MLIDLRYHYTTQTDTMNECRAERHNKYTNLLSPLWLDRPPVRLDCL
jgi:hypothetical protein